MMTETMMATMLRAHLHPPRIFCANFSNTDAPQRPEVKSASSLPRWRGPLLFFWARKRETPREPATLCDRDRQQDRTDRLGHHGRGGVYEAGHRAAQYRAKACAATG